MTALEDLMQAALTAPSERKEEALRVLRGQVRGLDTSHAPFVTEPYLSLREVGRRLGISACTLWRWQVPGHDLGGRRRFRASEVLAYLESDAFKRRSAVLRAERGERKKGTPRS